MESRVDQKSVKKAVMGRVSLSSCPTMVKLFFFFLSLPMLMLELIHFNTDRSSLCSTIVMKLRSAPYHLPAQRVSYECVLSRVSSRLLMWVCWEAGQAEG